MDAAARPRGPRRCFSELHGNPVKAEGAWGRAPRVGPPKINRGARRIVVAALTFIP